MVLALVLVPSAAVIAAGDGVPPSHKVFLLLVTLAKVSVFVALMLLVGRRLIPWLMHHTAHTGSRELFRLAVYAIALGVAFGAAKLFDVSFALGAFFAGVVMGESELSQEATEEAMPLRDAFAVLFFAQSDVLAAANLAQARRLIVTIPEAFEAGQVVEQARAAHPSLEILARAHSEATMEHLTGLGADLVVSGEREIAERMLDRIREAGA